jgi:predicted RNA-binding Zn-ribbon protein involved in translation (DUF1610 family)
MKLTRLLLPLCLALSVAVCAATTFHVRCPNCLEKQILDSQRVYQAGGYTTNINGMPGNMAQRLADFHCPLCHSNFTSQIKPDKFVPVFPAIEVGTEASATNAPPTPVADLVLATAPVAAPPPPSPSPPPMPRVSTNGPWIDEVVGQVGNADGSYRLEVIRRPRP